jgi:hypothetical protein
MPLKPHPTDPEKMVYVKREYDTSIENQFRQSGIWFDRGRQSAFGEIAEKVKEMPLETDTKDSFLIWLKEQK